MKVFFYNLSILFLITTLLSGCLNKQITIPVLVDSMSSASHISAPAVDIDNLQGYAELSQEDRVRLADIPFIEDCEPKLLEIVPSAERKYILTCNSNFSSEDTINYYRAEMDYLGWKEDLFFIGKKSALIFKKPSKICIVSLQEANYQNKYKTNTTLFVGPRSIYE